LIHEKLEMCQKIDVNTVALYHFQHEMPMVRIWISSTDGITTACPASTSTVSGPTAADTAAPTSATTDCITAGSVATNTAVSTSAAANCIAANSVTTACTTPASVATESITSEGDAGSSMTTLNRLLKKNFSLLFLEVKYNKNTFYAKVGGTGRGETVGVLTGCLGFVAGDFMTVFWHISALLGVDFADNCDEL
jgi:hypothetical protein